MSKKQKKSSAKKFIGSKVSRGTNNTALTPSGGQTQEASLEAIISSSTDLIVNQLKSNEETNEAILTALDKMTSFDTSSILKPMQESLEDKMTAMIGAMYGFKQAKANMKSTQYLSMLSNIDPQITANRGIYMVLKSIEDIISNMMSSSNDRGSDSVSKAVEGKPSIDDSKSNENTAKELRIAIDASGLDSDALGKLTDIFKMQTDGDLDISQLISNIKKFQEISTIPAIDLTSVESIISMNKMLQGINTDNLSNLNTIVDSLNGLNIESLSEQLASLNDIDEDSFESLNTLFGEDGIKTTLRLIHEAAEEYKSGDEKKIKNIKKLLKAINGLDDAIDLTSSAGLIMRLAVMDVAFLMMPLTWRLIDRATDNIDNTIEQVQKIHTILEQFDNLDIDKMKAVDAFANGIGLMNVSLSIAAATSPLAYAGLVAVLGEMSLVSKIVGKINDIDASKETHQKMKDVAILITACAGVMLIAALAGQYIATSWPDILGFTVSLGMFIFLTVGALNISTRGLEDAKGNAVEFGKLIAICGAIMLVGGTIMTKYPQLILGSMLFAVALGAFMFLVINAFKLATRGEFGDIHDKLIDMGIIVGASAALILVGGTIMTKYPQLILGSMLFAVALGAFMFLVINAFKFATKGLSDSIQYAEQFGLLIAISGAILLIGGGLFYKYPWLIATTPLFGVYLAAFIGAVTFAYTTFSKGIKSSMKYAKEFGILIALSGVVLLLGAYVLANNLDMLWAVPVFGVYLAAFIGAVTFAYSKFGKKIKMAIPTAVALGILIAVSAAAISIGGMLFLKNRGLPLAALEFAAITFGFTFAMSWVVKLLSRIKVNALLAGALALAGICVITWGFGKAFQEIAKVQKIAKAEEIIDTLEMMGVVLLAEAAVVGILGALASTGLGAAVISVGEAALAGLVGIILLAAESFKSVAEANNMIAKMEVIDDEKAVKSINGMLKVAWALKPMAAPALVPLFAAIRTNVSSLSACISRIGRSIKDISDLTISVIDDNGQVTGVRHLNESDFTNAAQNVETIITILGSTIIETYEKNKDIFSTGSTIGDLLGMDTPFARVCESCAVMGEMISDIAKGVKEYADMRIAEYDENGQVKGYRRLKDADFNAAARNVSTIITILGKAIIDTYRAPGAKEMFSWRLIGENPFHMVVESCSTMGEMISTIATAVRDYANLRVNIYDDKGEVIGTREMTADDFKKAATNVATILTTLGAAIIATYDKNPLMFTDPSLWHTDADKSAFGMVVKAMSGTGELISGGAQAIKDVLDLDIDWSEETKKELDKRISFCIGVLSESIYRLAVDENGNPRPAFTDPSLWHNSPSDTPVGMVIGSLTGSSALIKEGMTTIQEIMALPDIDEAKVRTRTALAISVLASEITRLATDPKTKKAFEDDSWWHTSPEKTPVGMVKGALTGASDLVKKGVEVIGDISKLNVNDKTIGRIVANIVSAIPQAILSATILNPDKELRKWWNDDPTDDFKDIAWVYKSMTETIDKIITTYGNANKLTSGEEAADIHLISSYLEYMLQAIPQALMKANEYTIETSTLDSIISAYTGYKTAIDTILAIYKSAWEAFKKIGASKDEGIVDMIGTGISKMAKYMSMSIKEFASTGINDLEEQVSGFSSSMSTYQEGIISLANAFNMAPENTSKYENMQNAIKGVNLEIANIPSLDQFKEETSLIESYVSTVNSISTTKVDRLTNLANALTNMSTKLGSLEGLTDVLANKVSAVLSNLTDSLDKSAKAINTAEKIQKDRHAKITDALKQLKSLMDKPLNVSVTHKQEKEDILPDGGMFRDTNPAHSTGMGMPSWASDTGSPATAHETVQQRPPQNVPARKQSQPIATTTGPSDKHIRSIAREEARDAINRWGANNSRRGGGSRTGAV